MKMILYEKKDRTKGIKRGKYLGEILFIDNKFVINCIDIKIKTQIEKIFRKSFKYKSGDPAGRSLVQIINEAKPYTPNFFNEVTYKMRDELNIIGVVC